MPKVTVIIPSYNHAAYISDAVESVLSQTEKDLELIVVDDGSRDDTLKVLSKFSDSRLKVIAQANLGAHEAINRGLRESSGDFLSILNSDDYYDPRRLEIAIAKLEEDSRLGLIGSYIQIVDMNKKDLGIKHGYFDCPPWELDSPGLSFRAGSDLRAALLTENYLSTTSNFIFPRSIYEKVGDFRPLRYAHDWDYALRVVTHSRLALLQEPLMSYRVHPRNTIREDQAAMIFEICWCLAVHLPSHVEDSNFLELHPMDFRVDQLLNSIYVYGMEKVLNVMLIQKLDQHAEFAHQLLENTNPVRKRFLEFIERNI